MDVIFYGSNTPLNKPGKWLMQFILLLLSLLLAYIITMCPISSYQNIVKTTCPVTVIVNESTEAWNATDQDNLKHATRRCGAIYKDAPCLKTFTKKGPRRYWALCGKAP